MNIRNVKTVNELVEYARNHKPYKKKFDYYQNEYNYILYNHPKVLRDILNKPENRPSVHDVFIITKIHDHMGSRDDSILKDILTIYKTRDSEKELNDSIRNENS